VSIFLRKTETRVIILYDDKLDRQQIQAILLGFVWEEFAPWLHPMKNDWKRIFAFD
jgi:hypothetical protein